MSAYDVLSFNGTSIASGTNYQAWLDARDQYVMAGTVDAITRRSAAPLVTGTASEGRTLVLHIVNAPGSALTAAQFRDAVKELFDPRLNSAGTRLLVIEGDDGTTDVQTGCYVMQWEYLSEGIDHFAITLWSPSGIWQATSLTTSAADPATVTNNGNTPVYPVIEFTTTIDVTRRVSTVAGNGGRGGLVSYPVVFALSSATATATNTWVFVEGNNVECYVDDPSAGTSRVWALVDTHGDGTTETNVDIIYGTLLTNDLCQLLNDGGMDFDDATNTTNAAWEWNDWSVSTFPTRPGAWKPALTGNHSTASDATYQITSEGAANVVLALGAAGAFDNSADSIKLDVGAAAGTSSALANLSRVTANLDGTNAQAYVRYRTAGSRTWQTAWSSRSNATVTTSIDLDNAVEITCGIENDGATADPATLTISGTTTKLTLASTPTVSVASASVMNHYARTGSTFTIGDRSITFNQLFVPDGTLIIDCENRTITHSVAGPFYGPEDAITFSDPDQWFVLEPGSNAVSTDTSNVSWVVKHRDGYS